MKMSNLFYTAQKEVPADAEITSHILMLRAGLIRSVSSGIYSFLPLGQRVLQKVETIIREEMDCIGAQEISMPSLLPAEPYKITGRWDKYGKEMFKLKDRTEKEYGLGPTHEEFFTNLVKSEITSYKRLPVTLYQIGRKYRDEMRPRFGLMRTREFLMKDAYSFDKDFEGLDRSYQKMEMAYHTIFKRCGLDYIAVDADSGAIGGSNSQEFMAKAQVGEDDIAYCENCLYSANIEKAECGIKKVEKETKKQKALLHTPNIGKIEDLHHIAGIEPEKTTKTLLYLADGKPIMAMVKGDRQINEVKLLNILQANELMLADNQTVEKITGAKVGFAGPIDLKEKVPIYVDEEITYMTNFLVGANQTDYHFININIEDFEYTKVVDIKTIEEGDLCPKCGQKLGLIKGIEIGHIFKLGTAYTEKMEVNYIDENGKSVPFVMGCYGIGVTRVIPAIIEQNHDEKGIIWPIAIAPYLVSIVPISVENEVQKNIAFSLYETLQEKKIEVLLDDRKERPGVKFKDSELIGIPYRITVGRDSDKGLVEWMDRKTGEIQVITIEEAIEKVLQIKIGG